MNYGSIQSFPAGIHDYHACCSLGLGIHAADALGAEIGYFRSCAAVCRFRYGADAGNKHHSLDMEGLAVVDYVLGSHNVGIPDSLVKT